MYVIVIKIYAQQAFMQAPVQTSSQTSVTPMFKAQHRLNMVFAPKKFTHQKWTLPFQVMGG